MKVIRLTLALLLICIALACAEVDTTEKNDNKESPHHLQHVKPKEVEQQSQQNSLDNAFPKETTEGEHVKEHRHSNGTRRHHHHSGKKQHQHLGANVEGTDTLSTDAPHPRRSHHHHHRNRAHQNTVGEEKVQVQEDSTNHQENTKPSERRHGRRRGHKSHSDSTRNKNSEVDVANKSSVHRQRKHKRIERLHGRQKRHNKA